MAMEERIRELCGKAIAVDDPEELESVLAELKQVTEEIDNSAGRQHKEATEASLQRFYAVLKKLDAEFKPQSQKTPKKS